MIDKMIEELEELKWQAEKDMELFDTIEEANYYGGLYDAYEKSIEIAEKYRAKEQTLEQIKWERDCTVSQLEELGTGLGEMPEIARKRIQEQKWISVDERLPEVEDRYLCLSKYLNSFYTEIFYFTKDAYELDEYEFAEYKDEKKALFYDYDSEFRCSERIVKYWMPLPELRCE